MMKDPVCNMMVDDRNAKFKSEHEGQTFYFCSAECLEQKVKILVKAERNHAASRAEAE